ncbi:hypothetical protein Nepgr_009670 [Nepenthes gracilis]|uniref:Probable magnesium transporter n=1 Tax=Nepenthes gracilis TaxID=150966 RepID=A0AAD3XKK3_NEPGR|nr:hypothetical protein Nepgr_009670 [Nepenthes gracilis]
MCSSNLIGFILACVSSAFIGSSFVVKKKGLERAGASGPRAGVGGYGYLEEPLWWMYMITMIVGEIANFVAYIYAPAAFVTPVGALSIVWRSIDSVKDFWEIATQPGYECKSLWHCNKTDIGGYKPIKLHPVMCFCNGCSYLYHHSIKALDAFNTAVISPIYYALFTSFTIFGSTIMLKVKVQAVLHLSFVVSPLCYLEQQYCIVQESLINPSLLITAPAKQWGVLETKG